MIMIKIFKTCLFKTILILSNKDNNFVISDLISCLLSLTLLLTDYTNINKQF